MSETQNTTHHDHPVVTCDGGEGTLGHPRVYLNLESGETKCPYCSKVFTLKDAK